MPNLRPTLSKLLKLKIRTKDGPGGPVRQVLDEDKRHQSRDEDQISLNNTIINSFQGIYLNVLFAKISAADTNHVQATSEDCSLAYMPVVQNSKLVYNLRCGSISATQVQIKVMITSSGYRYLMYRA
jgi:hypothetical protein